MNSNQIETKSVSYLMDLFSDHELIEANLSENDKTPSWDGNILLYNINKKNIIGSISVQVKGHYKMSDKKKKKEIVRVKDLKNYLNIGGTLYIIVHIDQDNNRTVNYIDMHLNYLKSVLEETKSNQKTKTLSIKKLPLEPEKIYQILLNFSIQCEVQMSFKRSKNHSLIDILKEKPNQEIRLGFTASYNTQDNIFEFLKDYSATLEYITEEGIRVPLKEIIGEDILFQPVTKVNNQVSINGITYFDSYQVILLDNDDYIIELYINSEISFTINFIKSGEDNNGKFYNINFDYKRPNNIDNTIKALEFFTHFLTSKTFSINDFQMNFKNAEKMNKNSNNVDIYTKQLEILKGFREILVQRDVQYDSLRLNDLSDNDWYNIELLYKALYLKNNIKFKKEINSLYIIARIADIKFVLLLAKQKSPNEYKIFDVFDNLYWITYSYNSNPKEDELEAAPAFVFLKIDDMINCSNISTVLIENLLHELSESKIKFDTSLVNNLILNLLNGYDKAAEEHILEIALVTSEWLLTQCSNDLYLLNYFQIKYRKNDLIKQDLICLENILKKYSSKKYDNDSEESQILFGCNVLLENKYSAKKIFENFSLELQKLFKEYPIYNLYK